jgi:plastocyanin
MKKYLILVLVVITGATVMIAGCTSSSSPSPSPGTSTATSSPSPSSVTSTASQNSVAIQNYAFNPSTLTIQKGANVTWKNYDSVQHTVTSDSGAFSSPRLSTGDTYAHQFNNTGSFSYHCSIHPYMTGTIVVVA